MKYLKTYSRHLNHSKRVYEKFDFTYDDTDDKSKVKIKEKEVKKLNKEIKKINHKKNKTIIKNIKKYIANELAQRSLIIQLIFSVR